MFVSAWDHHSKLEKLQEEINSAIQETITAVSGVLRQSTDATLKQYETLYDDMDDLYAPALEAFHKLDAGICRDTAEQALSFTTSMSGFEAANCATAYSNRVKAEIDSANSQLVGIDGIFRQIQSIVVKSFVGKNVFATPEDIADKIGEIFKFVSERWEESETGVAELRLNLALAISTLNAELGTCHDIVMSGLEVSHVSFKRMVNTCTDFNKSKSKSASIPSQEQMLEEFVAELQKLKFYEWSA